MSAELQSIHAEWYWELCMSFCDKQRVWVATAFGKLRRSRVRRVGAMFVALMVGVVVLTPIAAEAAPGPVTVSLTFDDGLVNQFNLAYNAPNGLKDAAVPATFFVNSGTVNQGANFMTWSQLATLAAAGNDIGGKTVNSLNLTTDPNPTTQVCQDRQNLMQHGVTPVAFAYPGGATNAAVKGIVAGCGYGNARAASGLAVGTSTTGTSAETTPPADWFATRVYAPSANTLVNLQSIVNNANAKGGGWVQIVIRRVCDQTLDAANYVSCSGSSGRIELQDLKDFVTWVKSSAPAGTTFSTVAQQVKSADTAAPTTAIACNGAACSSSPYSGAVTVALTPTDSGSGVSSTHYTTDGSDPTLSSPTYSAPFGANSQTGTTTVKFRTWDLAGNAEATQTQVIQASPDTNAPVTSITCNGTTCGASYFDSVSIALSAVDSGDAGVAHTYYTTDGSTPTSSSTEYTAPFTLGLGTKTVRFFSVDNAGNAETPQSRVIAVTAHATIVSLTFDDGSLSQYNLGYQHALQPRGAHATFFVNSGIVGASNNFMTWSQLSQLQAAGNDVGGKTINSGNLTSLDSATATQQVCGDRQALIDHGITPAAFAYPGGATNAITKQIVSSCGYGNARTGGGLGPAQGGQNAEPLPPADWLGTRAYAPSTITLANLQALVTNAASKGGGWAQIVLGKVCDATLDAANYGSCSASSSHVELSDLNAFLDWIGAAGQAGSAPAGVVLDTVANVAHTYDTISPTTVATCNGAPCTSDPYQGGLVRLTMSATDLGYGVASTHYTLDGSTPTLASPTYTSTVTLTTGVTTLKIASWDASGNAEPPQTLTINVTDTPDITAPSTTIACDGAPCQSTNYDGGLTASFTASDNHAGSGVDRTFYTLDGSDPTTSSTAKQYTSPFMLAGNTTVKFFSRDFAGNNEPVVTQQLLMTPYPVTVSLTFDDQYANLYPYLRPILLKHNMRSTIYVITSDTYSPFTCCLSFAQLRQMEAEGNDIGGHGVNHLNLADPNLTLAEKTAEVCGSRTDLLNNGIKNPVSYAYPFGGFDATAKSIVQSCGYNSSRAAGGISPSVSTPGPPWRETIPPADPFAIRAIDPDGNTDKKLSTLQNFVTAAAIHGGGWVPMLFHQVCHEGTPDFATCIGQYGVRDTVLDDFMGWLATAGQLGGAPAGAAVKSVSQVMAGDDATAPTTSILCNGSVCSTGWYNAPVTVSLPASDAGSGVAHTYYTTDGSTPTQASPEYSGPFVVSTTTTVKYFSTDFAGNAESVKSQTIQIDTGAPLSTISCNGAPCTSGWYATSPVTVALSAADNSGAGLDKTYYTTDGSTPTTSSAVYTGSFPVNTTTTVKFFSTDLAGNAEAVKSQTIRIDVVAPTSSITCNGAACNAGWYRSVTVALSATDNAGGSGVSRIYYTTDGSTPTIASSIYTLPFAVTNTTTVRFFATDVAGNVGASNTRTIQSDTVAPSSVITCNAVSCSTGWYRTPPVQIALSATDNAGGSGVNRIYYTTNGKNPTTASAVYSGPFFVSQTTTVKFFAIDVAGNAGAIQSRTIQIDAAAPTVAITNPKNLATIKRFTTVTIKANVSDVGTGTGAPSGIASVAYYLDGTTLIGTSRSKPYSFNWVVPNSPGTHTLKAVATDVAGNQRTSASIIVFISL